MTTINEIRVAADAFAGKMDKELGAATERLAVAWHYMGASHPAMSALSAGMEFVAAAHALVGQQGRDLAAMAKDAKPPDTPKPPQVDPSAENIVQWAKREHPETDIGNGYALAIFAGQRTNYEGVWAEWIKRFDPPPADPPKPPPKPPATPPATPPVDPGPLPPAGKDVTIVRWAPGPRFQSMDRNFMPTPVMAFQFTAKSGASGNITSSEYVGEPRYRQGCVSETAGDFTSPLAKTSMNGPASSIIIRVSVGADKPGHVRLESGRVYFLNVRAGESGPLGGWNAEFAAQQYLVSNSVAA